jgi:hypothetical protein
LARIVGADLKHEPLPAEEVRRIVTPSTITQLLIIAFFVLPGSVYQIVRARLAGDVPENRDASIRLLRALAASLVLVSVYLMALGPTMVRALGDGTDTREWLTAHPRVAGLLALLLLFVIPAVGAIIAARRWLWGERVAERRDRGLLAQDRSFGASRVGRALNRVLGLVASRTEGRRGLRFDPTATACDWAVDHAANGTGFVRVLGNNHEWKGGAFSGRSYFTSYPESPAIFVEQAWQLDDTGQFLAEQEGTRGAWIPCTAALTVEFLSQRDARADDAGA